MFEIENYKINIYGATNRNILVLMHEDHDEGSEVWDLLHEEIKETITFACISGLIWERELSPWEAPALFKKADPFTGGADEYLDKMEHRIIPEIQKKTGHLYEQVYICGYSLAGLFAAYAATKLDLLDGFVSASGSMWYPEFLSYMKTHQLSEKIKRAYFSIGDKEAKTKNPVMQTVEENTREIEELVRMQGVTTKFELNPGGHFQDDSKRLAQGIAWVVAEA